MFKKCLKIFFIMEEKESSNKTERVFARLAKDLSATTSAVEAADIILKAADDLIGWEASYLILYDPAQGGRPRPLLIIDTIDGKPAQISDVIPEKPSSNMLRAIEEDGFLSFLEQPIKLDSSLTFGDRTHRTLSQMYIPVRSGERTVAVLSIQSYKLHAYNKDSLETLRALSNHCAGALNRIWAQEALAQMVERLKALYQAAHAVSASLDVDQLYDSIHSTVEAVMPCDDFVIDGYDPQSNEIVPIYAIEYPRKRVKTEKYIADHGLAGRIVHTGESILFNSPEEMDKSGISFELYGKAMEKDLTQSMAAVPMILHGKVTGVISTQSYRPNAYTKDDLFLLELLSTHAAIAIENAHLFATIQQLADTDPLTGILSRRKFYELAERDFLRAQRFHDALSLLLIDIDDFKKLNDQFGHKVGDAVLQIITKGIKADIRAVDILCRYGGEEFLVILPNTNLNVAAQIADRLRVLVERADLKAAYAFLEETTDSRSRKEAIKVTISIGAAEYVPSCATLDILIDRADQAMYAAKRAGKNRVATWSKES